MPGGGGRHGPISILVLLLEDVDDDAFVIAAVGIEGSSGPISVLLLLLLLLVEGGSSGPTTTTTSTPKPTDGPIFFVVFVSPGVFLP